MWKTELKLILRELLDNVRKKKEGMNSWQKITVCTRNTFSSEHLQV